MIIKCGWHLKHFGTELVMGEKAPYDDQCETHGICEACKQKELEELDAIHNV